MWKNPKNWWKLMKIVNIDREKLHILWANWGISMTFSGKMWLMIPAPPHPPPRPLAAFLGLKNKDVLIEKGLWIKI